VFKDITGIEVNGKSKEKEELMNKANELITKANELKEQAEKM